ncbi:MAG: WD40 repeat domain-containing protein [Anaerolineae bacterium]|nr:WD40 repeat domain-containing protein [Anaerolineae bacterium]
MVTARWDGTARIWDVATGQTLRVLDNSAATGLYWAEFSPDGNYVMTGAELDNQVYIWRTELDDVIHSFCARSPLDLTPQQRAQYGISDNDPVCTAGTGQSVG